MTGAGDSRSIERWVRAAYLIKGGVYFLLGALCVDAIVAGPALPGAHGIGRALLVLGALGLAGYAVWRFMQGVLDFEHDGSHPRGLLRRAGYLVSGALHGALAVAAVQLSASRVAAAPTWVSELHAHTVGLVAIGAIGVLLMASGVYQLLLGLTSTFVERLQLARMSRRSVHLAALSGRVGVSGRGLVLLGLGALLAHGTYGDGGMAARSILARLTRIAATPFGAFLLVSAGLCLIAYGVHMFVWARYVELRDGDDATPSHRLSAHAR
jgi:hypothetical protein